MVYRTRQMTVCSGDATQNDVFPVSHLGNTPGALPAGLVQPCPNSRALIHKQSYTLSSVAINGQY